MKLRFLLFPLSLIMPMAACAQITVGAMAELTGQYSKLGEDCRKGYELAERIYGDKSRNGMRVIFGDSQGEAKAGLSEFQRLVNSERASVVVTSRSPVGLAVNPISKQKRIPVVGIVGHPAFTAQNPYALRVFPSSTMEGSALAMQVRQRGRTRLAVITLEDDYFLSLTEAFSNSLGKERIIFAETIQSGNPDYRSTISKVKAKRPDALLLNAGPNQLPALLKLVREQQLDVDMYSNFAIGMPDVIAASGQNAEGTIFVQLDYDKPMFRAKLLEAFGNEHSSPIGYSCFVGLSAVLQTNAKKPASPDEFRDRLLALEKIDVLGESIQFINREAQMPLVTQKIHGAAVRPF